MTDQFRVTMEDLATGERETREVRAGDYVLIPFAPCHLVKERHCATGTVVLTLAGRTPTYGSSVTIEHRVPDAEDASRD